MTLSKIPSFDNRNCDDEYYYHYLWYEHYSHKSNDLLFNVYSKQVYKCEIRNITFYITSSLMPQDGKPIFNHLVFHANSVEQILVIIITSYAKDWGYNPKLYHYNRKVWRVKHQIRDKILDIGYEHSVRNLGSKTASSIYILIYTLWNHYIPYGSNRYMIHGFGSIASESKLTMVSN